MVNTLEIHKALCAYMEVSVTRVSCSAAADIQLDNYTRLRFVVNSTILRC